MPLPGFALFSYEARKVQKLHVPPKCMVWEGKYRAIRAKLHDDRSICSENRELFERFFDFLEYKLKRRNGLSRLDRGCCRPLIAYPEKIRRGPQCDQTHYGATEIGVGCAAQLGHTCSRTCSGGWHARVRWRACSAGGAEVHNGAPGLWRIRAFTPPSMAANGSSHATS